MAQMDASEFKMRRVISEAIERRLGVSASDALSAADEVIESAKLVAFEHDCEFEHGPWCLLAGKTEIAGDLGSNEK